MLAIEAPAALCFGGGVWGTLAKGERRGFWGYLAISVIWLPFLMVPASATVFLAHLFR
jgi:hypothetical protein